MAISNVFGTVQVGSSSLRLATKTRCVTQPAHRVPAPSLPRTFSLRTTKPLNTRVNIERASLQLCRVQTVEPSSGQSRSAPYVCDFRATIQSTAPWSADTADGLFMKLIDRDTGKQSAPVDLGRLTARKAERDGNLGWILDVPVTKVEDVRTPGAIILLKKAGAGQKSSQDYISEIRLEMGGQQLVFPVYSWVSTEHGDRPFFGPASYLPSSTPQGLREARDSELKTIRGETVSEAVRKAPRKGADRIWDYQVYDDLGSPTAFRDALGGSSIYPYPRRIATNRPLDALGQEVAPEGGKPWLPFDEMFEYGKASGFGGNAIFSAIPVLKRKLSIQSAAEARMALLTKLVAAILDKLPILKRFFKAPEYIDNFDDVRDVLNLYAMALGGVKVEDLLPTELYPSGKAAQVTPAAGAPESALKSRFKSRDGSWSIKLDDGESEEVEQAAISSEVSADRARPTTAAAAERVEPAAYTPGAVGKDDVIDDLLKRLREAGGVNKLLEFPVPRSLEGRPNEWVLDAEMGRQALAGMNPCTIEALNPASWAALGSAITEDHIKGQLQGSSLAELLQTAGSGGKPRLFLQDYWALSHFWEATSQTQRKVQHAGRCVYYLRKGPSGQDEGLVPIAIELAHSNTAQEHPGLSRGQGLVYTPRANSDEDVTIWRLAKAVFRSLDSSYHQLVSHWLRTHACLEPFFIAMTRHLSKMHPVMRLMEPHFRYTLNINANARSSLINAGGIIETNFSAGEYALRLSAVVYKLKWRFADQDLPTDLKNRGMVDASGQPWLEYPYAQDGLDLHNAMADYFTKYLGLYYRDDQEVAEDEELARWWEEVKSVGHGDWRHSGASEAQMWGFEGRISSRSDLVHVLVTMAWTASAHHAAVNFGQYDFAGLPLAISSLVQKPMPSPGDAAYQEFVALARAGSRKREESLYLSYLADVQSAILVMVTVRLLSTHGEDEETLVMGNKYLQDPAAVALNRDFIRQVQSLEAAFNARNANAQSWTRAAASLNPDSMAYTLLLPSSKPGMTMRGVPYSVSI